MTARRLGTYVLVLVVAVPFGLPLLWLILGSFKDDREFFTNLWAPPSSPRWSNYAEAWTTGHIGSYTLNSVVVTVAAIVGVIVLSFPLAYGVARIRFRAHRVVLGLFAASLFIPVQIFVISLFDLENTLGIIDTRWAMILPYTAMNMPFAVLFLTAFLRAVPREIEEAALLDGANRLVIMLRVMAPLARPGFATVVVFTFLGVWNEFIIALTVTQSDAIRTLPVGLLSFSEQFGPTDYPQLFAALSLSAIPIFLVFAVGQRQFMRGLTAGGVKS